MDSTIVAWDAHLSIAGVGVDEKERISAHGLAVSEVLRLAPQAPPIAELVAECVHQQPAAIQPLAQRVQLGLQALGAGSSARTPRAAAGE